MSGKDACRVAAMACDTILGSCKYISSFVQHFFEHLAFMNDNKLNKEPNSAVPKLKMIECRGTGQRNLVWSYCPYNEVPQQYMVLDSMGDQGQVVQRIHVTYDTVSHYCMSMCTDLVVT